MEVDQSTAGVQMDHCNQGPGGVIVSLSQMRKQSKWQSKK